MQRISITGENPPHISADTFAPHPLSHPHPLSIEWMSIFYDKKKKSHQDVKCNIPIASLCEAYSRPPKWSLGGQT